MKRTILTLLMAAMSIGAMAEGNSEMRWKKEITEKGLFCIDYDDGLKIDPEINTHGEFLCPCSTDMGCVLANPHLTDEMVSRPSPNRSMWPKGTACDNPIRWDKVGNYVGKTFIVVGPVVKVTKPKGVRGNPTWIDIGAAFPNDQRLMLIIWGDQKSEFPMVRPGQLEGRSVCIIGQVRNHKGTPQIELRTANQFKVLR